MNKKVFTLLVLTPLLLVGCSKSNESSQSQGSQSESSESVLPDAPVSEISLSLANFNYSEVLPEPEITGLTAENVQVSYSYHNRASGDRLGAYVAGSAAGSINAGEYTLKAAVTSSTYKPFELSADFEVTKAAMTDLAMTVPDYYYDDVKPEANFSNLPAGSEVSYKYYKNSADKHDYVPGTANDIVPDAYTLEATVTNPNYDTTVKTYGFVVMNAQFDEAYSLVGANINVGTTDVGFSLNDVNLNSILSIQVAATSAELEGVTFTWKQEYVLNPGTPLAAKVIAHKEYFVDKEFDVTVAGTKKAVEMPSFTGTTTFTYDGEQHDVTLNNLDFARAETTLDSVFEATDAGDYSVKVVLKDKVNTCWSDGTTDDLVFNWKINRYHPAGSSSGFRLTIGDYVSACSNVVLDIDKSLFTSPLALKFEFRRGNGTAYDEYTDATFTVTSTEVAHIDVNGKLVLDDLDATYLSMNVATSNPNHSFDQSYTINIVDYSSTPQRTLDFSAAKTTTSFYGLDKTSIMGCTPSHDYICQLYTNGNGFQVDKTFKSVEVIKMKIHFVDECTYAHIQTFFSKTDDYYDHPDNVNVSHSIEKEDYDESTWIDFDYTSETFEAATDYYLHFWLTGSPNSAAVQIKEIRIIYNVA